MKAAFLAVFRRSFWNGFTFGPHLRVLASGHAGEHPRRRATARRWG